MKYGFQDTTGTVNGGAITRRYLFNSIEKAQQKAEEYGMHSATEILSKAEMAAVGYGEPDEIWDGDVRRNAMFGTPFYSAWLAKQEARAQ